MVAPPRVADKSLSQECAKQRHRTHRGRTAMQRRIRELGSFSFAAQCKARDLEINLLHRETTLSGRQSNRNKCCCLILTGGANAPTMNYEPLMAKPFSLAIGTSRRRKRQALSGISAGRHRSHRGVYA
jgi:hypothetical protein